MLRFSDTLPTHLSPDLLIAACPIMTTLMHEEVFLPAGWQLAGREEFDMPRSSICCPRNGKAGTAEG